jgi:hypothetical protein
MTTNGVMEHWSIGVLNCTRAISAGPGNLSSHHSITPFSFHADF